MTRLRTLLGIGLGLAVVAGAGWYISTQMATIQPTARAGRPFRRRAGHVPVGIAAAAKGDIPIVHQGARHRDAARHRDGQDPDHRPAHPGRLHRRPDRQAGRPARRCRPAPLRGRAAAGRGQLAKDQALLKNAADRPRSATRRWSRQDSIARQQLDTQAALVRQYEAPLITDQALVDAAKLNLAYTRIVAPIDRPRRPAPGRPGQLRADGRCRRHRRHHPDAADLGDLHHARGRAAAGAQAPARRRDAAR